MEDAGGKLCLHWHRNGWNREDNRVFNKVSSRACCRQEAQEMVLDALEARFGETSEQLKPQVARITDRNNLKKNTHKIFLAKDAHGHTRTQSIFTCRMRQLKNSRPSSGGQNTALGIFLMPSRA